MPVLKVLQKRRIKFVQLTDRYLGQLRKVQQQISDIDNEIVANRNNTRSVIQEHEHNTLVGLDKYEDPTVAHVIL